MFVPANGSVTHDYLDDPSGYQFQDEDAQAVRGGSLRLLPTGVPDLPRDLNWPKVEWTREDELPNFPDYISDRWACSFNNQAIGTPQTFEFETVSNFLDIDTAAGEYQVMRQKAGDGGEREVWPDTVDNAAGWLVQFRAQVIEDDTGLSKYHGHYIDIDDGTHHERIYLHADGLYFQENPSLNIKYDLRSQPREIRIGGQQDDLYILLDDGRGIAAFNQFTGSSTEAQLSFGTTGTDSRYRSVWDYVNIYTDELVVDTPPTVPLVYSIVPVEATTPAYSPKQAVNRWVAAYFETSGDLVNGDTEVTVQYRSSVAPDWTDAGDFLVDEIGTFEVLLDNVPTAEDGTDELRFVISQVSNDGLAEPPRIERITILTEFGNTGLRAVPHWGHRAGGNTVVLQTTPGADTAFATPSRGGERLLVPFDDDNVATVGDDTGTPSGTVASVAGKYGDAAMLGSATDLVDMALTPFTAAAPYGAVGAGVTPDLATSETLILLQTVVEENQETYAAQGAIAAGVGDGFAVDVTSMEMRFLLEVTQGSVSVTDGFQTHVFRADDYWTAKPVSLIGVAAPLYFVSAEPNSEWRVGRFQEFTADSGTMEFANTYGETGLTGFAVDVFVKPTVFTNSFPVLSTRNGDDGWEIGISAGGYPYVTVGDGAASHTVTSLTPILAEQWSNVALNFRRYDDHEALEVLVNGAVGAHATTTVTGVSDGDPLLCEPVIAALDQIRIHPGSIDAADFSQDNGFTVPYFQTDRGAPVDADNVLLLKFYESGGAFADSSGNDCHAYAANIGRRHLYRDRRLDGERVLGVWLGAKLLVPHSSTQEISLPHTVYGELAIQPNWDFAGTIYQKFDAGQTTGFGIYVTASGVLQVVVKSGGTVTEFSSYKIADQVRRAFAVTISSTEITIRVDGTEEVFTHATGSLAGADEDAEIGYGLMGYLRMLAVRNGSLSEDTFNTWRFHEEATWTPTDVVYVDGVAVPAAQVAHPRPDAKFVVMPQGEPGYVTIEVDSADRALFAERPYKYTYGYHRELPDRIVNKVAGTKSPFRLVSEVPGDAVNLAFVQQPDISVGQNVSTVDLSYKQAENLATYFGGDFLLRGPETGAGYLDYTGQVDTENVLVSNRSAGWKDLVEPAPLFYRYQIGRGRFYVYQPNALTVADAQVIRSGIKLFADHGQPLPFEDFSWDIEVTDVDIHGVALPTNVFSVVLYSTQKYIPGSSVLVQYYAADALNDWKKVPSFLEIVNTEPIFTAVEASPGPDEYALTLQANGIFDIQVGTV